MNRVVALALLVAFVGWVCGGLIVTRHRAQAWRTDRAIWTAAVRTTHPSVRAWVNYGNAVARDGEWDEARRAYLRAKQEADDQRIDVDDLLRHNVAVIDAQGGPTGPTDGRLIGMATGCGGFEPLVIRFIGGRMMQGLGCSH